MIRKLICPYCVKEVIPKVTDKCNNNVPQCYKCPECGEEIPRTYVEKNIPKIKIGLIGYRGHGKTVYITSLFYMLKKFENFWFRKKFTWRTLDEYTGEILHKHVPQFERESKLPESTPNNFPKPAIIEYTEFPIFGDFLLSFYDTAGEVFERDETILNQGRFVVVSDVVIFILSVKDIKENWQDSLKKILDTYIRAVKEKFSIKLKKTQDLVVVISKADLLIGDNMLPPNLSNYVNEGTYRYYVDLNKWKIEKLRKISREIKNWLVTKDAAGFVNMAEKNFRNVAYTLVSSTGAAPVGERLAHKLTPEDPKRVLDPLIWALRFRLKRRNLFFC